MFHPVGHQPPSVYWRRRLITGAAAAVLLVLIAVTVRAVTSGGDNAAAQSRTDSSAAVAPPPSTSTPAPTTSAPSTRTHHPAGGKHSGSRTASASSSSAAPPPSCQLARLAVSALSGQSSYSVGDKPIVQLQVVNTGTTPCVQNLADSQVELKVYNGESRVWDSHDCKILPGTDDRILAAGSSVVVKVIWSGYTSQPKCAGTPQRVGAGTYTLYAALSGKTGKAAQFSIS